MILHFKCHFCGVVVVIFLSILSFCIYTLRRKGVVEVLPFGPRNVNRPNFYFNFKSNFESNFKSNFASNFKGNFKGNLEITLILKVILKAIWKLL